ncbi:fibrous sheath CABYR-binding protein-like [Pygocentrus nattereri]|uniref:fibrous sheath CABYR-binding protein-like n=1 Tax=Pygocentrus nattereri TaxID=42514 RepID=UPI0018911679|nr:fibrous sheath CABYR-binding protein-like [Pygocentrus nattereri]
MLQKKKKRKKRATMEILLWLCLSHLWVCQVLSSPVRCQINQPQLQDVEHLSGYTDAQSTFIQQVSDYRKASVMDDVLAALLSLGSISDPMEAQRVYLEIQGLILGSGKNYSGKVSPPAKASGTAASLPGSEEGSGEVSPPAKASGTAASLPGSEEGSGEVSPPAKASGAAASLPGSEEGSGEVSPPAKASGAVASLPGSEEGSGEVSPPAEASRAAVSLPGSEEGSGEVSPPAEASRAAVSLPGSEEGSGEVSPPAENPPEKDSSGGVNLPAKAGKAVPSQPGSKKGSSGEVGSYGKVSPPADPEQLRLLESEVECEGFTAVNAAGHVSQDEAFSHVVPQEFLST